MATTPHASAELPALFAQGETARDFLPLVRLVDLVSEAAKLRPRPYSVAVADVCKELSRWPALRLYHDTGRAICPVVEDTFEWKAAQEVQTPVEAEPPAPLPDDPTAEEALATLMAMLKARKAGHSNAPDAWRWVLRTEPALVGTAGALQALADLATAGKGASSAADLRARRLGPIDEKLLNLAISRADAAALLKPVADAVAEVSEAPAARVLALVKPTKPAGPMPEIGPPDGLLKPFQWKKNPKLLDALNSQCDRLVDWYTEHNQTGQSAVASAYFDLAAAWKVCVSNVKQNTTGTPRGIYEKRLTQGDARQSK